MFNEQENYGTCFLVLRLSQPTITLFPEDSKTHLAQTSEHINIQMT